VFKAAKTDQHLIVSATELENNTGYPLYCGAPGFREHRYIFSKGCGKEK
jgi:hypothetical protein